MSLTDKMNDYEKTYINCPHCKNLIKLSVLCLRMKMIGHNVECEGCGYKGVITLEEQKEEEISPIVKNGKIVGYKCQLPPPIDGHITLPKYLKNAECNSIDGWTYKDKPLTIYWSKE